MTNTTINPEFAALTSTRTQTLVDCAAAGGFYGSLTQAWSWSDGLGFAVVAVDSRGNVWVALEDSHGFRIIRGYRGLWSALQSEGYVLT
jgi:hypothetical protein